jgi:hypothetical protein
MPMGTGHASKKRGKLSWVKVNTTTVWIRRGHEKGLQEGVDTIQQKLFQQVLLRLGWTGR